MAADRPEFKYPSNDYRVTKARDALRERITKFVTACPPGLVGIDNKTRTALVNVQNWQTKLKRPDAPAGRNEVIESMRLVAGLVKTKAIKDQLNSIIKEAEEEHEEFSAAYEDYYFRQPLSGIRALRQKSPNETTQDARLRHEQNLVNTHVEQTKSGVDLIVDVGNKMVMASNANSSILPKSFYRNAVIRALFGPFRPDKLDHAIKRAGDPDLIGAFNPCSLVPSVKGIVDRLADQDFTGYFQRRETTKALIKCYEANMPPEEDVKIVFPYLRPEQKKAVTEAMEAYNKRALQHQQQLRLASTGATVSGPSLAVSSGPAVPPLVPPVGGPK